MQISCAWAVVRSFLFFGIARQSTIYISVFMPLKSTSAFPWNLIEIVSCVKEWKRCEKEGLVWNLKRDKLLRSYAYWKVDIFSYRTMPIAKISDQFENSVFVIVDNEGEYTPYRYSPFESRHKLRYHIFGASMFLDQLAKPTFRSRCAHIPFGHETEWRTGGHSRI